MNSPGPVHGLTAENLLAAFPIALQGDQSSVALANVTARLLARRPEEINRLLIYPDIAQLDEKLLDILAYDFKVDWWDADYSLEEKRRVFKSSWYVHKHLGTKAAVETAIRAIYPKADVQEWFAYEGGKPYHFRLNIDLSGELSDAARPYRVLERVNFYKSLRSHVDELIFTVVLPPAALHVGGAVGAGAILGVPQEPDRYAFQDTIRVGGSVGTSAALGVPQAPDRYDFQDTIHTGGGLGANVTRGVPQEPDAPCFQSELHAGGAFASRSVLPFPEDISQPSATTILRTGGVCTIISNLSGGD